MRRFLVFGVSAAISVLAAPLAGADSVKPRQGVDKPRPGTGGASRGTSRIEPASASQAETADDAEANRIRAEDERRATESKRKMKKRPGYREEVPAPRV
jgi:hypothetical protein